MTKGGEKGRSEDKKTFIEMRSRFQKTKIGKRETSSHEKKKEEMASLLFVVGGKKEEMTISQAVRGGVLLGFSTGSEEKERGGRRSHSISTRKGMPLCPQ